jgi:hypothetical protein
MGGGWVLEIKTFLGPVKWHQPSGECHLGPKKLFQSEVHRYSFIFYVLDLPHVTLTGYNALP